MTIWYTTVMNDKYGVNVAISTTQLALAAISTVIGVGVISRFAIRLREEYVLNNDGNSSQRKRFLHNRSNVYDFRNVNMFMTLVFPLLSISILYLRTIHNTSTYNAPSYFWLYGFMGGFTYGVVYGIQNLCMTELTPKASSGAVTGVRAFTTILWSAVSIFAVALWWSTTKNSVWFVQIINWSLHLTIWFVIYFIANSGPKVITNHSQP